MQRPILTQLRMRLLALLLIPLLHTLTSAASEPAPDKTATAGKSFSDAQRSAAVSIDHGRRRTEASFKQCIARAKDDEFRISLHIWQVENLDVTLPAERVLATLPADRRAALERLLPNDAPNAVPNDALCNLVSTGMRHGDLSYAKTDADAARTLRPIYADDDTLRIAKRNADLALGCVKQNYNMGARDFALMRSGCDCQMHAIISSASDAEIDEWLAHLDTNPHPPWFAKVLVAARQCTGGSQ